MAKRNKQPRLPKKSLIEEFLKKQQKPINAGRMEETIQPKKYFLLVCEGGKTEPNYFSALGNTLPEHLADLKIHGDAGNTIDVVKTALRINNERKLDVLLPDYDKVYVIFDKDDFPNKIFNEAILLAEKEEVVPAYSNEAFELWYVLHFQYLDIGISRKGYQEILRKNLGIYEKNDPDIYHKMQEKGNEALAIKYAEKLLEEKKIGNPAKENPTTKVHELVIELNMFK